MKFLINRIIFFRNNLNKFLFSPVSLDYLNNLRILEVKNCLDLIPQKSKILDFGSGTGIVAKFLSEKNFDVVALDIKDSTYSENEVFKINYYNGRDFPFEIDTFDLIYSSNVFEHIFEIEITLTNLSEITKKNAFMILIMPSSTWRFFTNLTDLLKKWHIGKPHGEHSKNSIHEIYTFSSYWWKKKLTHKNWEFVNLYKNKIFYTGNSILGSKLSFSLRNFL